MELNLMPLREVGPPQLSDLPVRSRRSPYDLQHRRGALEDPPGA
ncbi:hypothetical protein [Streptomyces sp. NPDC006463]